MICACITPMDGCREIWALFYKIHMISVILLPGKFFIILGISIVQFFSFFAILSPIFRLAHVFNPSRYCTLSVYKTKMAHVLHLLAYLNENNDLPILLLGDMFEVENKMVVIIVTLRLYCNIPDCLCKHLCKLQAPARAPVRAPAPKPRAPILIAEEKSTCLFPAFPLWTF